MLLEFPSLDHLLLAIKSGGIPTEIAQSPARCHLFDDGRVTVEAGKVPRSVVAGLTKLGAVKKRKSPVPLTDVTCWWQIPPLTKTPPPTISEKSAVLFHLPAEQFPEVVNEMLRLGNDRQAFRALQNGQAESVLLRVIGPPYYSLLRALDGGGEARLSAYVEQAPRVWVRVGYRHPLADRIEPPPGKFALLDSPREWTTLDDAAFQDVYSAVQLELPEATSPFADRQLKEKLKVPVRLVRGGTIGQPDLWVLSGKSIEKLDEFVQSSDEQLLRRLSFAVGERDGDTTVVIRTRPSKEPPPVLVLDGLACRSYLRLPNLFVPGGMRIHPPLRRDIAKELLAANLNQITWLAPIDAPQIDDHTVDHWDGWFTPRSLSDSAFRPLSDWVKYVLDEGVSALSAWVESSKFDFESFICPEETAQRPQRKKPEKRPDTPTEKKESASPPQPPQKPTKKKRKSEKRPTEMQVAPLAEPSELEQRLRQLEKDFLEVDLPLDHADRDPQWREMAELNGRLKNHTDARACWSHVLWGQEELDEDDVAAWSAAENCSAGWEPAVEFSKEQLDGLLKQKHPTTEQVNALAAQIVAACRTRELPDAIKTRLGPLIHFMETHEAQLSLRAAWLCSRAVCVLTGGDELVLARARDRLLERLYHNGLSPDRDVPGFLRASGLNSAERFRAIHKEIVELHKGVHKWSRKNLGNAAAETKHYIDLIFAYAVARLGEHSQAAALAESAEKELPKDEVHEWCCAAYRHRIAQVLDNQTGHDSLPAELLKAEAGLERFSRFKLDRLRQSSSILEPHERIDPFGRYHQFSDDLNRELLALGELTDRNELAARVQGFLDRKAVPGDRLRIVTHLLSLAPRLGAATTQTLLAQLPDCFKACDSVMQKSLLLERGLFAAAHFGMGAEVSRYAKQLNDTFGNDQFADVDTLKAFEGLISQSLRGLRKMGLRDEVGRLLEHLELLVQTAPGNEKKKKKSGDPAVERAKMLLHVAAGWFYFNRPENAWKIIERTETLLREQILIPVQQTAVACAYVSALSQAPVEQAMPRIAALFRELKGTQDMFATNSHFSLSQLRIVEALVLSLVGEDFLTDSKARSRLDEDEFLIRQRMHRDLETAMG